MQRPYPVYVMWISREAHENQGGSRVNKHSIEGGCEDLEND